MLDAILEGALEFGPIVFLMLLPILIPVFAIGVSAIFELAKASSSVPNPPDPVRF